MNQRERRKLNKYSDDLGEESKRGLVALDLSELGR